MARNAWVYNQLIMGVEVWNVFSRFYEKKYKKLKPGNKCPESLVSACYLLVILQLHFALSTEKKERGSSDLKMNVSLSCSR